MAGEEASEFPDDKSAVVENENIPCDCSEEDSCSESVCNLVLLNEDIFETFREELERLPELHKYIIKLRSYIKKQHRKIKRLLEKVRQKGQLKPSASEKKDVGIQTDFELDSLEKLDKEWQESKNVEEADKRWKEEENEKPTTVAEQVKEAAESAMQQTGFVYEETSGMYYDYNTGYYYNAELGLYYDGNTGTYYYFNEESNSFQFHSQIEQKSTELEIPDLRQKTKLKPKPKEERRKRKAEDSLEEGECSDTTEESDLSSDAENSSDDVLTEQAIAWPPCMRLIVKESGTTNLKVGTLFIVPYTGGTVGREGDHVFCLPDINISKSHFKLEFNEKENKFFVEDLGSRNGTILNGQRLEEGVEGHQEVVHGSILQLGNLKLLCHIHVGRDATCGHCEPGLVQQNATASASEEKQKSGSKGEQHWKELKRLKKKFGLQSSESVMSVVSVPGYEDRAQMRREKVGSQNPYEKTEMASVDEHITPQNKGFQLLERMGWSQGQSLGKDGDGCTEPVTVTAAQGKAGLGSDPGVAAAAAAVAAAAGAGSSTRAGDERSERWRRTQQRYKDLA